MKKGSTSTPFGEAREWFLRQEQRLFVLRFEAICRHDSCREMSIVVVASGPACRCQGGADLTWNHFEILDWQLLITRVDCIATSPCRPLWDLLAWSVPGKVVVFEVRS